MDIPADIRKQLGNASPEAYATLSCGLDSPIGETALVVADGQLFVFTRESFISEFRPVSLDRKHAPRIERGDFNDTLYLSGAEGDAWQLNVSSFEREGISELVALCQQMPAEAASTAPTRQDDAAMQAHVEGLLGKYHDIVQQHNAAIARDTAGPQPAPPAHAPRPEPVPEGKFETEDIPDPPETADKLRAANLHHGNDMPTPGCFAQLALFAGGVYLMWYMHDLAMVQYGVLQAGAPDTEGFTYVATKILAVICGCYLGGKLAGFVARIGRARRWLGHIEFNGSRLVCTGPAGAWRVEFDLDRPIDMECRVQKSSLDTGDPKTQPQKVNRNVQVRLFQDGNECFLKAYHNSPEPVLGVAGMHTLAVDDLEKHERAFLMDSDTLRHVLKRVRDTNKAPRRS